MRTINIFRAFLSRMSSLPQPSMKPLANKFNITIKVVKSETNNGEFTVYLTDNKQKKVNVTKLSPSNNTAPYKAPMRPSSYVPMLNNNSFWMCNKPAVENKPTIVLQKQKEVQIKEINNSFNNARSYYQQARVENY